MLKTDPRVRLMLVLFIVALAGTTASAASLIGKVIEVHDGDLVTISSLNRPVKIRLMAIDAPDVNQPYAEIARTHLSDLILNKLVLVEYSGLVESRYILGRMMLDNLDIGAQMLRDGVAWYDSSGASRLTVSERETYTATENLARQERRGLWQDDAPVSPWAFRESLAMKMRPAPVATQTLNTEKPKPAPVLSNNDLMRSVGNGGGSTDFRIPEMSGDEYSMWKTLSPRGYDFSVLVPSTALESGAIFPISEGRSVDSNVAVGVLDMRTYFVVWGKGPLDVRISSEFDDDIMRAFVDRMNRQMAAAGSLGGDLDVSAPRKIKAGVVIGSEYTLTSQSGNGVMRIFSRQTKTLRRFYIVGVLNTLANDIQINEFLNSMNFTKPKTTVAARKTAIEDTP